MKTNNKSLKTLVFSLVLAAMTLTANNMNAQNDGSRGLFGRGANASDSENSGSRGMMNINNINDNTGTGFTNEEFGVPMGSGIAILIGAGLGYVALKKKEDEQ